MKLAQILQAVAKADNITSFNTGREIPFDRVVDQTTILRLSGKPQYEEKIELMDAKLLRIRKLPKNKNTQQKSQHQSTTEECASSQSLPDSEPPFWARQPQQ